MSDDRSKAVHAAVARLLTALGISWETDPNYRDTPLRVATWLLEKFPDQVQLEAQRQLLAKKVFPSNYGGVVTQTGIRVAGLCPHHLLPIVYDVSVGYLPTGYVVGLSKLARLAELELGAVGTQEDLTAKLAESMCAMLHTVDIAVVVTGVHNCMVVRGVKQRAARTTTSEMWGSFRSSGELRSEFFHLAHNGGSK